jgi:transposase
MNERKNYPSDITREQFEIIKADLESARKTTKPRDHDLYEVFCAILYLLKEGCSWRAIPHDFPNKSIVRYYYDIWAETDENGQSLFDKIQRELVEAERKKVGRAPETTMLIVDSKSVQNADTAEVSGYDAGKKKRE